LELPRLAFHFAKLKSVTLPTMGKFLLLLGLAYVAGVLGRPQTGSRGGNSQCAQWCATNFPANPGALCTSPAAHGGGPCYQCGPLKTNPGEQLCRGACTDTNSDNNNCGACGHVCPFDSTCQSGVCKTIFQSCPTASHACGAGGIQNCDLPNCACTQTPEGLNACTDIYVGCDPTPCTSSTQCQPGFVCDIGNCCGGVCVNAAQCVNHGTPKRIFRRTLVDQGYGLNVPSGT